MSYRCEYAKLGTSKCKGPLPCKGSAIAKASLRFGTVVDINGNTSFQWRHWGCLTKQVIHNVLASQSHTRTPLASTAPQLTCSGGRRGHHRRGTRWYTRVRSLHHCSRLISLARLGRRLRRTQARGSGARAHHVRERSRSVTQQTHSTRIRAHKLYPSCCHSVAEEGAFRDDWSSLDSADSMLCMPLQTSPSRRASLTMRRTATRTARRRQKRRR